MLNKVHCGLDSFTLLFWHDGVEQFARFRVARGCISPPRVCIIVLATFLRFTRIN